MNDQNIIPIISSDLVLKLTHGGSIEQIFMVAKVSEPMKFSKELNLLPQHLLKFDLTTMGESSKLPKT